MEGKRLAEMRSTNETNNREMNILKTIHRGVSKIRGERWCSKRGLEG